VRSAWLATLQGDPRFYPPTDPVAIPVVITFDQAGYLVAGVIKFRSADQLAYVQLTLIHPETLATRATFDLPGESTGEAHFRPAGAYFYLDHLDRVVVGTADRDLWLVTHAKGSADSYFPAVANTDKFFVYYFAWDCDVLTGVLGGEYCAPIPDDLPPPDAGDPSLRQTFTVALRAYIAAGTHTGPDSSKLLKPRIFTFAPKR